MAKLLMPSWVENITSTETFFQNCSRCSGDTCRSSRDQQANFFIVNSKGHNTTACAHCKPDLEANGATLLQIRRSSHQDVVKVQDVAKLCADAGQGVQAYTINGQKVVFLRTRVVPKLARGVPHCITCQRGLQDNNVFCSLECKKVELLRKAGSLAWQHICMSSASSVNSDGPATPPHADWRILHPGRFNPSSSSDDSSSPAKRRRKCLPHRSPFD